ncbi:MAG: glycosyltransferase [Candidatus Omnitrophota bacterium]|nr:glycosyltransferase [Candidatus Omnitrophota bacterium]
MKTEISVIMSVYTAAESLAESVESILSQTFRDLEFIIVNDASTDGSGEILRKYREKDSRVTIIDNPKNMGLTRSLNTGLKAARGKYVARQDAGDISLPERLERQYNFLEANPDVFLVGCGTENVDPNGRTITVFRPVTDEAKLKRSLLKGCSLFHPTIMFRNADISYREKFVYSQDYDLYLTLLSQGRRITNMPDILVKYNISPGAISFTKRAHQMLFAEKALEFYRQRERRGKDEYMSFDPDSILKVDIDKTHEPRVLEYEIEAGFKINDFKKVRALYARYVRLKRSPDKYIIYYLASFLPRTTVNMIRKILWGRIK